MRKTFIIAEVGVNANGDVDEAASLIDRSIECGADAIKFQYWCDDYYDKCEWRESLDGLCFTKQERNRILLYCF